MTDVLVTKTGLLKQFDSRSRQLVSPEEQKITAEITRTIGFLSKNSIKYSTLQNYLTAHHQCSDAFRVMTAIVNISQKEWISQKEISSFLTEEMNINFSPARLSHELKYLQSERLLEYSPTNGWRYINNQAQNS